MSYKKRKIKKNKFNQLKYGLGLVKIALLKFTKKVEGRKSEMRLPQTRALMDWLRKRSRLIRPNNPKINEWVDDYINECALYGKPVEILTQWCISKDLEVRYETQGNTFVPTKKELSLFKKDIPLIIEAFNENGIAFNWWVTFNRSYLDSGRINPEIEEIYVVMIRKLAEPIIQNGGLVLTDWEKDILGKRPEPGREMLASIERLVDPAALELEIQRHSTWTREEAKLDQSDQKLKEDVYLQIACEAEEGKFLSGDESPLEQFILMPLETPERYDFFTINTPDFKKRIVTALSLYPWRLKEVL